MYDILINYMKLCHIAKEKQKAAIIFTMCVQRWKCLKSTDSVMQVPFFFLKTEVKQTIQNTFELSLFVLYFEIICTHTSQALIVLSTVLKEEQVIFIEQL